MEASLPGAWVNFAMMGSPARSDSWTAAGESFCSLAFSAGVAGASMRV
jgi:hypothetical protein